MMLLNQDCLEGSAKYTPAVLAPKQLYHLESRWRNSHVLVYYGPLLSHLLGVAIAIYFPGGIDLRSTGEVVIFFSSARLEVAGSAPRIGHGFPKLPEHQSK